MTLIDREGEMGVTHATRPPRHPLCSIRRVQPPARSDAQIIWFRRQAPAVPSHLASRAERRVTHVKQ